MAEQRKIIFISCGQYTDEERELGQRACDLVTQSTTFEGYFAQNQTTLKTLSENVLRRLYSSAGLIVIMHHRGKIEGRDTVRASVWIEQEIAMATMMEQVLGRPLHVALFIQRGIAIEGIRQQLQLNPIEFSKSDEVIERLRKILPNWTEPLYESLTLHEREAIKRKLAVTRINALHPRLTFWVTNRSESRVLVKSASLWHGQKRLCGSQLSEGRNSVQVDPNRENFGIGLTTDDDAMVKLQTWGVVDRRLPPYTSVDNVDIEVRIDYDVLGVEDEFREPVRVRIHGTRQIESL